MNLDQERAELFLKKKHLESEQQNLSRQGWFRPSEQQEPVQNRGSRTLKPGTASWSKEAELSSLVGVSRSSGRCRDDLEVLLLVGCLTDQLDTCRESRVIQSPEEERAGPGRGGTW